MAVGQPRYLRSLPRYLSPAADDSLDSRIAGGQPRYLSQPRYISPAADNLDSGT